MFVSFVASFSGYKEKTDRMKREVINAISVDLEDWYHICGIDDTSVRSKRQGCNARLEENIDKILNLFKQHDVHATFFTVGLIAENSPAIIKKIAEAGHELASHGFAHRRIFDMSPEEFEEDLVRSKIAIEKAAGKRVLGYRAPEWSLKQSNLWALDVLKKVGFAYDASAVPLTHLSGKWFGLYPHEVKTKYGNIMEFPLSTFRCFWERLPFSGGLPMRINPYFHILDNTVKINSLGHPVMFYLHPWELDSEHERIELPINRKFMHYCNIKSTDKKIKLLLERLEFSTVEDILGLRKIDRRSYTLLPKRNKYYDAPYFLSAFSGYSLVLSIDIVLFIAAVLIRGYAFLIVIIFATIFYWPWGLLFTKINALFHRK